MPDIRHWVGEITDAEFKASGELIGASALFHNDHPDGIGVTLDHIQIAEFEEALGDDFQVAIEAHLDHWDQHATREIIEDQLWDMGRAKHEEVLSPDDVVLIFANVLWLEARGHLETSEFDGVLWARAKEVKGLDGQYRTRAVRAVFGRRGR